MDNQHITRVALMQADKTDAGITVKFLVIASLLSVLATTVLFCALAGAVLVLVR